MKSLGAAAAVAMVLGAGSAGAVEVVASIRPVHSLVASVMEGVGSPVLLLGTNASPHSASLKPSQARALADADVVFWIGPDMETFLESAIANTAEGATAVALAYADGVELLPVRESEHFAPHLHDDHDDHDDHADHDDGDDDHGEDGEHDAHVWLDPLNARAMLPAIAIALGEADPANAQRYRENAVAARARLATLFDEIEATLAPVAGRPFVVFHDAYQYLEARTGLTAVGALSVNPEVAPGARHLSELRETIAEAGATCVFAEPQFPASTIRVVTEGTPARTAVLDPLGGDIEPGPELYETMIRGIVGTILDCLEG